MWSRWCPILSTSSTAPDVISSGGEDFGAFAVSRWPGLVRLAFGLTGDRRAAEDIAQATLARAYVAWRRVRRADDPDAYLRRILAIRATVVTAAAGWPNSQVVHRSRVETRRRRQGPAAALRQLPPGARGWMRGRTDRAPPPRRSTSIIRRGRGIRVRRDRGRGRLLMSRSAESSAAASGAGGGVGSRLAGTSRRHGPAPRSHSFRRWFPSAASPDPTGCSRAAP